MKEIITLFSPQWWSFKNRLLRSDRTTWLKTLFILALCAGFWVLAQQFLSGILMRLQGMEGSVGTIVALKGLSLILMLIFFLLIFSSFISALNSYYLSPDLLIILSSPVSWGSMFLSKWLETAVRSSWMILFALLPVMIAFGLFFQSSALYYICLLPVLGIFVLIPVGIGVLLSIALMAAVPAKRAKNVFIVLGLMVLGAVFLLFRIMRPERFANPEWFANTTIFLSELKLPVSVFLPSMWTTEALSPFFSTGGGSPIFYVLLLFFTACSIIVFGKWLFDAFYYRGYVKAQLSAARNVSLQSLYSRVLRTLSVFSRGSRRALAEKDAITFFRNVGQSSQLLLLMAIVVIYLFSIKALPLEWGTYLSLKLKYIISFFNIAIVGFVITAVATRLVLPSVGSEGRAFWIIRVSPLTMKQFLWSKFSTAFVPLLVLALTLITISNLFLGVRLWFMVLGIATVSVLVATITGLAVGLGAYSAQFSLEDKDREQSGFQGAAYMLSAFAVILVTVVLEFLPGVTLFLKEISGGAMTTKGFTITAVLFSAVFVLNALVLRVAMKMGEKKLMALE